MTDTAAKLNELETRVANLESRETFYRKPERPGSREAREAEAKRTNDLLELIRDEQVVMHKSIKEIRFRQDKTDQNIFQLTSDVAELKLHQRSMAARQDEMAARQDEMAARQDEMAADIAEIKSLLLEKLA